MGSGGGEVFGGGSHWGRVGKTAGIENQISEMHIIFLRIFGRMRGGIYLKHELN